MSDQLTLQRMAEQYKEHDKADAVNFREIKETQHEHVELMKVHGEHLSHFRSDLNITMSDVKELKEDVKEIKEIMLEHIKKVEPILEEYRDREGAKRTFKKYLAGTALVASGIGAWNIIKSFLFK